MNPTGERLYALLPAFHRLRDEERKGPLRALCEIIGEQAGAVEADVDRMWDDWFIETCDEWVVPYLGDLLGVRHLLAAEAAGFSQRARVANTLAYRRRKGTATMLEQLARDSTGWPARVVEFFDLLITAQNVNHLRPHNLATPNLRRADALELLGTPFDSVARTVDVRHISNHRGQYNLPNIGLFLWRLQAYPLRGVTARPVAGGAAGRFTFSPLGQDVPLFHSSVPESEISHLAEEINLPTPLRRRPLYEELEALRYGGRRVTAYFPSHGGRHVFRLHVEGEPEPIPPGAICVCDLSEWRGPDTGKAIRAAVDPVFGRLAFDANRAPKSVRVDFAYGFSGDVGGGPYDRRGSIGEAEEGTWLVGVTQERPAEPGRVFNTLGEAIDAWNARKPGTRGRIVILDSCSYVEALTGPRQIIIPEGSQLAIVAADAGEGAPVADAVPRGNRPHIRGALSIQGTATAKASVLSELVLNGLLLEGNVEIDAGNLARLELNHCTVVPAVGEVVVTGSNPALEIMLSRCIVGRVGIPSTRAAARLRLRECIVDGQVPAANGELAPGAAIECPTTPVVVESSTILGTAAVQALEASNCLFTQPVSVVRRQTGCVRFSYVPDKSTTGRRHRCQPELALDGVADAGMKAAILARLQPAFTSQRYAQPGYAQLRLSGPREIRTGADNESEMGVFGFLQQPQREAGLLASLDEYLRFGLEAGIDYAT